MQLEKLVRLLKILRRFELGTVKWIAKTLNFTQKLYFLRLKVFFLYTFVKKKQYVSIFSLLPSGRLELGRD